MVGGHWQQPAVRHAPHERRLITKDWARLLKESERFDAALLVDSLGAMLLPHVRLDMVRRTATEAIRLRTLELRLDHPSADAIDDADAAADRLANTLKRIDARQGEGVEPAAAAIAVLARPDYPAACALAQKITSPAEVLEQVILSLRLPHHDVDTTIQLIMDGVSVTEAVATGAVLGDRHWWPGPLRELALDHVRGGRKLGPLVECLDGLGFSNLSPMQQRAALRLLNSPGNPYGLDPNAIAAAVRGVSLKDGDGIPDLWRPAGS